MNAVVPPQPGQPAWSKVHAKIDERPDGKIYFSCKVLTFLAGPLEKEYGYVPAGTYGMKLSADGGTLYINFNGHAGDAVRPRRMRPNGFGLCGFAAVHIPAAER